MARANRESQYEAPVRTDAVTNSPNGMVTHNADSPGNGVHENPGNTRAAIHTSQVDARRKGDVRTDDAVKFMRPATVWQDATNENPYLEKQTKLGLPAPTRGSTDVKENDQAGANQRRR